jgi:hypothetical protein
MRCVPTSVSADIHLQGVRLLYESESTVVLIGMSAGVMEQGGSMNRFWLWLANSPYAGILKVAVGGALAAVLAVITNDDGTPRDTSIIVILGAALIPYILHLINPVSRAQYAVYKTGAEVSDEIRKSVKAAEKE